MTYRVAGVVKSYRPARGYGFIVPNGDNQPDHFFHVQELRRAGLEDLMPRQRVTFRPIVHYKGPRAVDIQVEANAAET